MKLALSAALLLALCGCDAVIGLPLTAIGLSDGNNARPIPAQWSGGTTTLCGAIFPFGDFDIYDLGPFDRGDMLHIEADARLLKPCMLVIDADTQTVLDGFDGNTPNRTSFDILFRDQLAHAQLFIGPGHLRLPPVPVIPYPSQGIYRVTVQMTGAGITPPPPAAQTIVLDFTGGTVTRYFDYSFTLPAFDAADYGLSGQDADLHKAIRDRVAEIWSDFNVRILTTDDPPPAEPASRVYFTRPGFFAIGSASAAAGQVRYYDFGNRDPQDVAIVSESARNFLTIDRAARSLGYVAAHEIGHLLGLLHQQQGLMSYTASSEILSGPLVGYFGFVADPQSSSLFPKAPTLLQPTRDYLTQTIGPRPAASQPSP